MGLVGDPEAEGATRGVRVYSGGEEDVEAVARSYLDMVFLGKLSQVVN